MSAVTLISSWKSKKPNTAVTHVASESETKHSFRMQNHNFVIQQENDMWMVAYHDSAPQWLKDINMYVAKHDPSLDKLLSKIHSLEKKYRDINPQTMVHDSMVTDDSAIMKFNLEEALFLRKIRENIATAASFFVPNKKVKPIFSRKETGEILLKEFKALRDRYEEDTRFNISVIDHSIFNWKIIYNRFTDKERAIQMEHIQRAYGYSFIEVHMYFHPEMYPMYPPFIKVIRPRLHGNMMSRISNWRRTNFDYWTPNTELRILCEKLYIILNKSAKVHCGSKLNNVSKYPNCAFLPIEDDILQLAQLTDNVEYEPFDDDEKKMEKRKPPTGKSKDMGSGYGTAESAVWDIDNYNRLQEVKNTRILELLKIIHTQLETITPAEFKTTMETLEESYLITFIKSYLKGSTLMEIDRQPAIYEAIFKIINILASEDGICFIAAGGKDNSNIFTCFNDLRADAVKIAATTTAIGNGKDKDLIDIIIETGKIIDKVYPTYMEKQHELKNRKQQFIDNPALSQMTPVEKEYAETMGNMIMHFTNDLLKNFSFPEKPEMIAIQRLRREFGSLQKILPACFNSTIFLRVSSADNKQIRVVISGPAGTPYDGGLFVFDMLIPYYYPQNPPKMKFLNHGGKRFNPNLYADGGVCLSLLGTWSGHTSEKWNAGTSTLSQLLISIQSMIFVEQPYFNEPGYEKFYGTQRGDIMSKEYNRAIRLFTMTYAMADLIEKPEQYPECADLFAAHFKRVKDRIMVTISTWVEDYRREVPNGPLLGQYEAQMKRIINGLNEMEELETTV